MQEGFDYKFVNSDLHSSHFAVKLLSGTYSETVYVYGNVNLTEEEVDGETFGKLSFSYEIDSGNETYSKEDLKSDRDFQNHIGRVLESIITKNEFKIGHDDQEN
jgi:hypothetical protein